MVKFFFIIFQVIIILLLVLFITKNEFVVTFEINDFAYSFPSSYFLIILIVFLVLVFILQSFYFKTKFRFSNIKINYRLKKKEKGYNSFVNGMIALANKDYKKAIVESSNISNYLDDNPALSLLLKSQILKVEKKYEELNIVYEAMTKNIKTENLGYRGLMEQYLKAQDYHHAFIYGEKLFYKNPYIEKIYDTLVNIVAKTNNWQQLLNITDKALAKKIINKKTYQENKSISFYEIAKIKQFAEIYESISYVKKALNLRKNFPPYVKLYLELLIQNKNYNLAKKILRKAWKENPHPEYKSTILLLAKNLQIEITDFVKSIVGNSYQDEETKILIVEASIANKNWDIARKQIKDLIDIQPKKEICLLMAKIEEGDTHDIQKINSWTMRSQHGAENNIWVCLISNQTQLEWSALSSGGYFNSLNWQKPILLNSSYIKEN